MSAVDQVFQERELVPSETILQWIEFDIPGDCVPWARAGSKGGHRYTPPKQAKYMAAAKLICQAKMKGAKPIEGPIALTVWAAYAYPKSWSAKKRQATRWHTGRPDYDNLAKIVGDALNGVAWLDDSQIASARVEKFYSGFPGLRIRIARMP